MSTWITRLVKYGLAGGIGAIMVYIVLILHGYGEAATAVERYRILSDAFTIPGVTLMLVWVLLRISDEGAFEGLSYVCSYAFRMLIPGASKNPERFGDYVLRRREKGPLRGTGFLFFTGAAFFLVALVFIALFYSAYSA